MKVNVKTIIYREYYYNFARTRTEQMLPLIIAGDIAAAVTSVMLLLIARRLRRSTSSVSCMCRQHPRTYLSLDVARSADDSYPAFDPPRDNAICTPAAGGVATVGVPDAVMADDHQTERRQRLV